MADDPIEKFGGKTPLQYAKTPTMDRLASAGVLGTVLTVPEGMPPGSDTAILSIFGCDPRIFYGGRAPLEAAASGIKVATGDVAYRCNMVSFEDGDMDFEDRKIISHSAGSVDGELADMLIEELFELPEFKEMATKAKMIVYPGTSFRHIVVQKTPNIKGLKLIPPHDHLGEALGHNLPSGCDNAVVLKTLIKLAYEFLNDHPANIARRAEGNLPANGIWFWAEGESVELPDFSKKYGMTGGVVSEVPLCQGIAILIGLKKILVEGATGELDTNYEGMVDVALELLETCDFVAIHIEAPDECTHNGDTEGKLQAIEWIDSRVLAPLIERLEGAGEDFRMLFMSDHKTLTSSRGHDGSPVPFIIYDSGIDNKTGLKYCEDDAMHGGFLDDGTKLMGMLFDG